MQADECSEQEGWGRSCLQIAIRLRNAARRKAGADRACRSRPGPGMQREQGWGRSHMPVAVRLRKAAYREDWGRLRMPVVAEPRNAAGRKAGADRASRSRSGRGMLHGGRPGPIAHTDRSQPEGYSTQEGEGRSHMSIEIRLRNAGVDRTCRSSPS
ncbi:hypothetical protein CALVIDRAFT_2655 [Calocera viscosa TUFC12733]|uniref:Uncharacterized protein n=1 Tax=Calocera viscosa (strain TUFC12733) TaxID=1330018 RepID=A0A167RYU9_CALVF|nr:hypothetical protein CALVIDRAFT_2655 [Calocera viscosa TUFC12733]